MVNKRTPTHEERQAYDVRTLLELASAHDPKLCGEYWPETCARQAAEDAGKALSLLLAEAHLHALANDWDDDRFPAHNHTPGDEPDLRMPGCPSCEARLFAANEKGAE